jgi:hypothetical protein
MDAANPQVFPIRQSAAALQFLDDLQALRRLEGSLEMLEAHAEARSRLRGQINVFSDIARSAFARHVNF